MLYWVSAIINDDKPSLIACSSGEINLENALKTIENIRQNHIVLSAWIDTFDINNNKNTIFHECYVNALGQLDAI